MVKKYKKKSDFLMESTKGSVRLGLTSMVGLGAVSAIGSKVPGSSGITSSVATGLNLVNIGNTANIGLNLAKGFK
jgi:hypothetical protein